MNIAEAVAALDAIAGGYDGRAHADADSILQAFVPPEVAAAYDRVIERSDFWAYD